MNAPRHTAATANQGASGGSRVTAGRAGSRRITIGHGHRSRRPPAPLPYFKSATELLLVLMQNFDESQVKGVSAHTSLRNRTNSLKSPAGGRKYLRFSYASTRRQRA